MDASSPIKNRWPEAILIAVTVAVFAIKNLFSFLSTTRFAGRDLVGNYAFTHLMRQNIVNGQFFAWTHQWFLGFPSFKLYPPLFFFTTSSLDILTGQVLGPLNMFKTVVFLSVFLIPLTAYISFKKLFGDLEAFFAGFYTLYFLFVYPPVSQSYQVFSTGLVAQGFAFLLLLPSLALILDDGKKKTVAGGLLLGLTGLAHPFVAFGGFAVSVFHMVLTRETWRIIPPAVGAAVMAPWLIEALPLLGYVSRYSFDPANTGTFLYLLLPLIVLGGYRGAKRQALLLSFVSLLAVAVIEMPVVSQELRFYTYALGFGSLLAGMGAFRLLQYLEEEIDIDPIVLATLLLIPVVALSLQADLPRTWEFNGDAQPLYSSLEDMEEGRVLVETQNRTIFDSYVLQANIPLETGHKSVNDVHLDSSTSANYILTLESWVSEEPLYNPICRTCNTSVSAGLTDMRMDDLGVRYAVARTEESRNFLQQFMEPRGNHGDYWLFENREDHKIVEPLDYRPVAVEGSYDRWKEVNDVLFTHNISIPVLWLPEGMEQTDRFSDTVQMDGLTPREVLQQVQEAELERAPAAKVDWELEREQVSIESNITAPVRLKLSYYPSHHSLDPLYAGNFNTMVVYTDDATISLG
ncbi:MAG: hypothetical protein MUP63_02635 [Candidatus Nanohaloarchaeota archaeon QJJ-7]|nr:hypothetical protein [Candidatus Nanohaloarchaeota archaeon QJJ-7]